MLTGKEPISQVFYANGSPICAKDSDLERWMEATHPFLGLNVKQFFAYGAMKAILGNYQIQKDIQNQGDYNGTNFKELVSINACDFAEALIAELNNREKK